MKDERDRSPKGRFQYLAEKRVDKALSAINSVGKLSDTKNYEYTDDQVQQITDALNDAVQKVANEYAMNRKKSEGSFKLK